MPARRLIAVALTALVMGGPALAGPVGALAAGRPAAATATATANATATAASTAASTTAVATPAVTTNPLTGGVSPLAPLPTTTTTPTVATNVSTASSGSSSVSSGAAIAIAIGAIAVLGGISFFIWRDARRRAPVAPGNLGKIYGEPRKGTKAPPKPRKLSPSERRRRKRGRAR